MSDFRGGSPISDAYSDGMDSLSMREKALLKRSVSKHHNNNCKAGYVPVHEQYLNRTGLRGRKTFAFWTLVGLLFVLAVGNLILTVTILGVLRLGQGMQSMELISEESVVKFFGDTDLGHLFKADGKLESFADSPIEISGDEGPLYLNVTSRGALRHATKLAMEKNGTVFKGLENFEIRNKDDQTLFSTSSSRLHMLKNANNLRTKKVETNRIVSPRGKTLKVEHTNINLKGVEGTQMESREIIWSADQDIYLTSINGSLVLGGKEGTFVDIKRIPVAQTSDSGSYISSQYKVCVCMPQGKLFRVPVPNVSNARVYCDHINMSDQNNPCM